MNPREFCDKLTYTGQLEDLKNILIKNGLPKDAVGSMSPLEMAQQVLLDYEYITTNYNGEDILLIKRAYLPEFFKNSVWLQR